MRGYRKLRYWLLHQLKGLDPTLTYHGYHHTIDVLKVCNRYIQKYKLNKREAYLLRIAALAHDIGFLESHKNHEERSAKIVSQKMQELGFDKKDISEVESMILATQPYSPSERKLEKILCDADLDYLGRNDFEKISNSLYEELRNLNIIKNHRDWMRVQERFLESHSFQTDYAKQHRGPKKEQWLEKIRDEVNSSRR